jgi:hypothetical protein
VRLASFRNHKSTTARRTGRHRAQSRVRRPIKIIGVAAPAVALVASFVAYQAQSQPNPVASSLASYYQRGLPLGGVVADGSGTALITRALTSGKTATESKPPMSAKANAGQRSSSHAKTPTPAPSASPQGGQTTTPSGTSPGSGSASLASAVQKDVAAGNNLLAVAQYLVEHGYSDAAAAGIASCVDGESGGNPESVGSGGGGLIGWTPISSAAPNPNIITGNAAQDMMTQLADVLYYNSTEIGRALVVQLNGNSDPVAAADFFSQNFEKPAVLNSDVVPSVADQVFSELGG